MKDSKATQAVRLAYQKGYHVLPSGEVKSPSGKILKLNTAPRYLTFSLHWPGCSARRCCVRVHQLAAYQKFGEAAYMAAECVRHLNGDSYDNQLYNIELGTIKDNYMDRPKEAYRREKRDSKARRDWDLIDADRSEGMGYSSLNRKYGVSKGCLSYRYSKAGKGMN